MHVALVAPMVSAVRDDRPPLGGVEIFLLDLIRGLLARGVRVSLLAADGSHVRGAELPHLGIDAARLALASLGPGAAAARNDERAQAEAFRAVRAWCQANASSLDVVHAHAFDAPAFDALQDLAEVAVAHTLHLPPLQPAVTQAAVRAAANGSVLIAVSRTLARAWESVGARIGWTICNGLDVADVPFGADDRGYLLYAGRLSPEKGPEVAVEAARRAGWPLLLVGNIYDPDFYARSLRPLVEEQRAWAWSDAPPAAPATYVGHRPRSEVLHMMAGAATTLMPVRWDEPFGLVAIEAQAAGSPVVGFARGALGEVVHHGQTGQLVPGEDPADLARAIDAALALDRAACRRWVAENFSLDAMVDGYLAAYRKLAPGAA